MLEPESVLPRLLIADAVLEQGGASGVEIARRMLSESEEIARRWEGLRAGDVYSRELMSTDPGKVERLERAIATTQAVPAAVGETP